MKIHKYNTTKYNFAKYLLGKDTEDSGYKVVRSKKFGDIWKSFVVDVITKVLDSDKVVIQKLPSYKIHLTKTNYILPHINIDNGMDEWSNMHNDGGVPYNHPTFDTNYWLPLMNVDLNNTMYIEKEPVLIQYGEFIEFQGNTKLHGAKIFNNSDNTRYSIDFRGCKYDDYDETLLDDRKVFLTDEPTQKQNEHFVIGKYYSMFERRK